MAQTMLSAPRSRGVQERSESKVARQINRMGLTKLCGCSVGGLRVVRTHRWRRHLLGFFPRDKDRTVADAVAHAATEPPGEFITATNALLHALFVL